MRTFLTLAISRPIVLRGLLYAATVGPVLIALNHFDSILAGDIDAVRAIKITLTPIVPYVVSTLSSVQAIRRSCAAGR